MGRLVSAAKNLVPPTVRLLVRRIYYLFIDAWEAPTRDPLTPPKSLVFVGGGDFKKVGELLKEIGRS